MAVRRKKAGIVVFQREYTAPDGSRRQCSTWTARVNVHGRTREKALGTRERRVAEIKAAEWARDLEFEAAGLSTHHEARGERVEDLIEEYGRELLRQDASPDHVKPVKARLLRMFERGRTEAGTAIYARSLAEITPVWIRDALTRLERDLRKRGGARVAPQTVNKHWRAAHAFFEWLIEDERWSTNPCRKKQLKAEGDPTFERRALARDEFVRLLEAAPWSRRIAYLVAATTGFRRRELRALTWARVDLEAGELRLTAAQAKNRKRTRQPIPVATVAALQQMRDVQELEDGTYPREHVQRILELTEQGLTRFGVQRALEAEGLKTPRGVDYSWPAINKVVARHRLGRVPVRPEARLFPRLPEVDDLRVDLAAAGIPYETDRGRVDFHAIRKCYATALKDLGVSPDLRRQLARHASFELTDRTYTDRWDEELREAVARLDSWLTVTDTARALPGLTHATRASPIG